jgi:protein-L-isoaspartate(D-aspartate) O-methyltransferase
MTQLLELRPDSKVLEIGTGSGYQAAVLAELCRDVYTIEILEPLATRAAATLKALGYERIHARAGDGYLGWPEAAPFDGIIVTCAPENIPTPLREQLAEGGRLVIPVGPSGNQQLVLVVKEKGELVQRAVIPVRFVPMTGPGVEGVGERPSEKGSAVGDLN